MVTRIRKKGQITIPSAIREALKLSEDSVLSVAKVGNAIILMPQTSVFESVSKKFSNQAKKESITLDSLLKDLKKIRHSDKS